MDRVRLAGLDVFVSVSGPPREADETFDIRPFEPPALDDTVFALESHAPTERSIAHEVEKLLKNNGFNVTVHVSSSTDSESGALGASLRDALGRSAADAVLIVRAVPVDAFFIDVGAGSRTIQTAEGRERVRDFRPEPREGRLLVGQAFLFDRATGLRLWSKQAPDYPEGGRLTPNHPFLRYGHVGRERGAPLAEAAARAFVPTLLADLPGPSAGDPAVRAELLRLDATDELQAQTFLDEGHWFFEAGGGWGPERSELELSFFEADLGPLETAAVTPAGVFRVVPRVSYLTIGGWMWSAAVPVGLIPGGFGRTYHQDNPTPTELEPRDRTAHVEVRGTRSIGFDASVGPMLRLSASVIVVPRGGPFLEVWEIDAAPAGVFPSTTHVRFGGLVGSDLVLMGGPGDMLFARTGAEARIGTDLAAPRLVLGFGLTAGVGVMF